MNVMPEPNEKAPESRANPELAQDSLEHMPAHADTKFVLIRHGEYEKEGGAADNIGFLTHEGVEQVRNGAKLLAQEALDDNLPTDFYIAHSPTPYDIDIDGTRAEHSAVVIMDELIKQIDDNPEGKLAFWSQGSLSSAALSEPNIHYVAGAEDPKAYIKAQKENYGAQERWEGYHRGNPEVDAIAKQIGAETSADVGGRMVRFMQDLAKLEAWHRQERPGRRLVFILATHNDNLRAVIQHEFGADEAAHGYQPGYGEMLEVAFDNKKAAISFDGHIYAKEFRD